MSKYQMQSEREMGIGLWLRRNDDLSADADRTGGQ
jgi:hypothetical protein